MQHRRARAATWAQVDPVLPFGVLGIELADSSPYAPTGVRRLGNGEHHWSELSSWDGSSPPTYGVIPPPASDGQIIYADSTTDSGYRWDAPPSGGGGGGVSSVVAGAGIAVDSTTPSAPVVALANPLTLTNPRTATLRDVNGNMVLDTPATASAVNYVQIVNKAAGAAPSVGPAGSDTNISMVLAPKGTGVIVISVPTGQTPTLRASGADTNHDLNLEGKGTGVVKANGTQVQTVHANLTALTGLTGAANKLFYFTGAGAMALGDLTGFARNLLSQTDAAAMRSLLGALATELTINAQTANYTLAASDTVNTLVTMNHTADRTITIPLNSTTSIPVGRQGAATRLGTGNLTLVAEGGVTLLPNSSLVARVQNSTLTFVKIATNTWLVGGDAQ